MTAIDFGIPVRFSYNDLLLVPLCLILAHFASVRQSALILTILGSFAILSLPITGITLISVIRPLVFLGLILLLIRKQLKSE